MSDSPIKVLVVEDNSFMQSTIERMVIDMEGVEVVGLAADGVAAVKEALATKPDVILMDIVLPKMDGIEASRKIKHELSDVRILMVSGDEGDDSIVAAFAAGADGFCTKSTVLEQLERAIRTVATGQTWLDPVIGEKILSGEGSTSALRATVFTKLGLTALEITVLRLLIKRVAEDQIAGDLAMTLEEVKAHVQTIRGKLMAKQKT
ncbi:MAG TPA: response regulator transcription factor [Candidatus Obscuribacterales bacterium]